MKAGLALNSFILYIERKFSISFSTRSRINNFLNLKKIKL